MIHHGDCLEIMPELDAESISAVVTDPPYGLGFMGKGWDRLNHEWPAQAFRVAKPGAHLLAFGGTRTYHRLAAAIEDAGWEIRDCLVWAYASGFPKSLNLGGEWDGWGTALKPAWEPIVMARKPLRGTVAANVAEYGTGALNIDGTRIGTDDITVNGYRTVPGLHDQRASSMLGVNDHEPTSHSGRWPANVVLTDPIFDGGIEGVVGGGETTSGSRAGVYAGSESWTGEYGPVTREIAGDAGTYSRFFLIPKADRAEREPVLSDLPRRIIDTQGKAEGWTQTPDGGRSTGDNRKPRANVHPTVKPVDLMRHLVRLVTPPGGVVLDPFLGSGTTGIACEMEGFDWIGIEREAEYVAIAEARLVGVQRGFGLSA